MDQGAMDDTAKSAKVSVEPTPTTSNRIFWYRLTVSFTYEETLIITLST